MEKGRLNDSEFPLGKEVVESVLPHRDPFLWVSRIVSCEPGVSAVGELDVSKELPLFAGHFPQHPVLPGVIIMEALAQVAAFSILCKPDFEGKIGFLIGMDKAKFRGQVAPGDILVLESTITKSGSRACNAHVVAKVDGKVVAQADQMYAIG